jgi:hypothetical protein
MQGMNRSQKLELKSKVGDFITSAVESDLSGTRSPVTGRIFPKLSKKYKTRKTKLGRPGIPDLKLKNHMIPKHEFKEYKFGVEVGVFDEKEALKADNHCKFSGKSKNTNVPRRTFVPNKSENYRPEITKKIKQINKEFRRELGLQVNNLEY